MERLYRVTDLPRPIDEVFEFFSDATNLQRITPDWFDLRILTPLPIEMREGALIDYKLKIQGVPVRWRTRIAAWEPPHRFIDEQLKGPYTLWVHEHRFEPIPGGTRMYDEVTYLAAAGPLSSWITRAFAKPRVESLFDSRSVTMREIFGEYHAPNGHHPAAAGVRLG